MGRLGWGSGGLDEGMGAVGLEGCGWGGRGGGLGGLEVGETGLWVTGNRMNERGVGAPWFLGYSCYKGQLKNLNTL